MWGLEAVFQIGIQSLLQDWNPIPSEEETSGTTGQGSVLSSLRACLYTCRRKGGWNPNLAVVSQLSGKPGSSPRFNKIPAGPCWSDKPVMQALEGIITCGLIKSELCKDEIVSTAH